MKKLLFTTVILSSLDLANAMNPEDMQLQIRNGSDGAIVRSNEDVTIIGLAEQSIEQSENLEETPLDQLSTRQLLTMVNLRELGEPLIIKDKVQIPIHDFVRSDIMIVPVGDGYTRQYPLQKTLLRYEHNLAAGFSNPIQELYAEVNDIEYADRSGKIVVDDEYLDNTTRIPHQRRATGQYEMDDANLSARPFTEVFIVGERGEEVVDSAKVRDGVEPVAYIRTNTPAQENTIGVPETRANDAQFNYQRIETLEDWRRPNETIFTKRTEDWRKVAKPTPLAPVPPSPITVTIPVHHWNKPTISRGGRWDYNVRWETLTVAHGAPVPTAIELNSNWSFNKYWY
ncbi:MAG: hypothetical protein LBD81_00875 [Holosporaceae bacterium]|jgi:hypothetical protein|nr:hypothetical protein [Holosporaceae bacterium]